MYSLFFFNDGANLNRDLRFKIGVCLVSPLMGTQALFEARFGPVWNQGIEDRAQVDKVGIELFEADITLL